MEKAQDTELKCLEEKKNINSKSSSNINNYSQQINNNLTKKNALFSSTQEFSSGDTLYGNNYLKYYLNNKLLSSHQHIKPKKMGNLYVFLFINDQPIFAIGNFSLSLVIIYELLLQISFIIIMKTIINKLFPYMKYMLVSFYLNCFFSHMFLYLINPGIPNIKYYSKIFLKSENYMKLNEEEKKGFHLCEVCNIIVNYKDDIDHCNHCGICIKKYDHHCYWTGKCIGKNNLWAFTLFTLGTLLYIVWYFILIIFWIILQIAHFNSLNFKKDN